MNFLRMMDLLRQNLHQQARLKKPSTVLGLELARINSAIRKKFKIKDRVDGVIVLAEKR